MSDTPKKSKRGRQPVIEEEKRREMKEWLLNHPSHRHIFFHHLPRIAPELGLEEYGFQAIRTAMTSLRYRRQRVKREGFSEGWYEPNEITTTFNVRREIVSNFSS